jgi:hypothetical protein
MPTSIDLGLATRAAGFRPVAVKRERMVKRRAASAADVSIAFEKSAYAAVAARTPVSFFRKFRCCPIRCFAREKRSARFFRLDCLGYCSLWSSLPKLRFPRHWSVHRKDAGPFVVSDAKVCRSLTCLAETTFKAFVSLIIT